MPHVSGQSVLSLQLILSATLDLEVARLRSLTFAESTRRTYNCQLLTYLQFCGHLNIKPVPITPADLGRYIAYLSSRLSFSSVRQYLNAVRLMHLEAGFPNPLLSNWYLASILKGLKRLKGDSTRQKLPITCHILQGILRVLDLSCPFDITFWAACLVGFFSFFRKSNLLIPSTEKFDPQKHLCRADVQFHPSGVILLVRWSKTIQFRQRTVQIPLPHIAKSPFCPSSALLICFRMVPTAVGHSPLFCYPSPTGVKPITHAAFTSYLRQCLKKLGIDPSLYSGHSFRRGGTSFALQCGLPADLIKLQGDWSSNAYQRYIDPSLSLRQQVASTLGRSFHTFLSQSQN